MTPTCPLCQPPPSHLDDIIIATPQYCVIWANEPGYPCYVRVVWHAHVAEMTQLSASERNVLMSAVFAVETAMRAVLLPEKINLASLGNWVAHLHWHVVARFKGDPHWPNATFSQPNATGLPQAQQLKSSLAAAIVQNIHALS